MKMKVAGFDLFSSTTKPGVPEQRRRLREDMQGKFVKVSYNEFMARFLPPKGTRTRPRKYTKAFNKALQVSNVNHLEKDMYEPFVR